jgi:FlaA1/EpsC-like NDP-sugar epimerase
VGWHEDVDVSAVSHKVVLVTGAAGSIGSELCRQILLYSPVKLILLDNNESGLHDLITELSTEPFVSRLQPFLADITNRKMVSHLFETYRPQIVFHSAAYKHVPMLEYFPDEAVRVNIGGTYQLAELARDYKVERFVLISTDKAVHPSSVMGASKRICELLMHAFSEQGNHKTLFTSVRFGNVLGSRGSVVPTFDRQIDAGGPITVTDPEMTRYFMTIPEAVNLVIHAACLTRGDDLFMLRMGEVVRIVDLAERMIRLRGLVPYKDIAIKNVGLRPGEKLHEELRSDDEEEILTLHPHIVELVRSKNGLQPESFSQRLSQLCHKGLDPGHSPLDQLREIISLGEANRPERVH